jgi:hypothetical protein
VENDAITRMSKSCWGACRGKCEYAVRITSVIPARANHFISAEFHETSIGVSLGRSKLQQQLRPWVGTES